MGDRQRGSVFQPLQCGCEFHQGLKRRLEENTARRKRTEATVTVVADDPGAGPLAPAHTVQIAGLWFSANSQCSNRPLLLVPRELVGVLSVHLAGFLTAAEGRGIGIEAIMTCVTHLRNELTKVTGVEI